MYWISKTGVYQFDTGDHEGDVSDYPDAIMLFEVMMFVSRGVPVFLLDFGLIVLLVGHRPHPPQSADSHHEQVYPPFFPFENFFLVAHMTRSKKRHNWKSFIKRFFFFSLFCS